MQNLIEIQAKIAELQKQEKMMLEQEYKQAIEQVQSLISKHKITASDLIFGFDGSPVMKKSKAAPSGKKAVIKYRDESGNSWSGRGLKPKWLVAALAAGKKLEGFLVA